MLNERLGLEDDHLLEEFAEEQIEQRTGWDIDLTPFSREYL